MCEVTFGPGVEVTPVSLHQSPDIGLVGIRVIAAIEKSVELGLARVEALNIPGLATQHEVLFMPAHHQHEYGQLGIVEGFQAGLNVMDRCAQLALEPAVMGQAETGLLSDDFGERFAVPG